MEKRIEKKKEKEVKMIAPPRPDWKCKSCKHTLMLKPADEAPKKCPKCGSTKILSFHLQKM
jgi:putative FmdB family regulatory protein